MGLPSIETYVNIIHPNKHKEVMAKLVENPDWDATITNALIVSSFSLLLLIALELAIPTDIASELNYSFSFFGIILSTILGFAMFFVSFWVMDKIAGLIFKTAPSFRKLTYLFSVLSVSLLPVSLLVMVGLFVINSGTAAICIYFIVLMVVSIYSVYLQYRGVRATYPELSMFAAIAVYVLYGIAVLVLSSITSAITGVV
jgi:hypothetical protein